MTCILQQFFGLLQIVLVRMNEVDRVRFVSEVAGGGCAVQLDVLEVARVVLVDDGQVVDDDLARRLGRV